MKLTLILLFGMSAFGQPGQPVNVTEGPAQQSILAYTGTNLIYVCTATSTLTTGLRAATTVAISAISKANPGVVTSTAHGFKLGSRPQVTISGATGTGWVSGANTVNGTFVATVIDADTFSIPVNTTGNGTLGGTVVFTTTAPRQGMPEWSVKKLDYDGSNNLIGIAWLLGSSSLVAKCTDATSTTVQLQ